MTLTFRPMHALFVAEASSLDLARTFDAATLAAIRDEIEERRVGKEC